MRQPWISPAASPPHDPAQFDRTSQIDQALGFYTRMRDSGSPPADYIYKATDAGVPFSHLSVEELKFGVADMIARMATDQIDYGGADPSKLDKFTLDSLADQQRLRRQGFQNWIDSASYALSIKAGGVTGDATVRPA